MAPYSRSIETPDSWKRDVAPSEQTGVLFDCDVETIDGGRLIDTCQLKRADDRKLVWVWRNIILFSMVHLAALYGGYLIFAKAKFYTIIFAASLYSCGMIGVTAGAHRLWSHRSYKAKWPMRLILTVFNTIAFQDSIYHWVRDHRMHHKYSETDADPHNTSRGFFYSHIGWLLCKKHPEVTLKGKALNLSDLRKDPLVMFQHKHYYTLMPLSCFVLPTVIPMLCWNESLECSLFVATLFRWCLQLNMTWLVNSAAHKFGGRPYDKTMNPSQNAYVSVMTFGEGWHNFHHVFPWDYRSSELGNFTMSLGTIFIDLFAILGWAYDRKSVTSEMIQRRSKRTGDGSHALWGWGDKDMTPEEKKYVIVHKRRTKRRLSTGMSAAHFVNN